MKNFEQFKEQHKKAFKNVNEEKIKKIYKRYYDYHFNKWLFQFDADVINNNGGLEVYKKIFDAMLEDI